MKKNNIDFTKIHKSEWIFGDLVKCDIDGIITYNKKKLEMHIINNLIIICINLIKIDEKQFPNLSKYDNVEINNITIYKIDSNFNLMINDDNVVYIELCKNINLSEHNKKILNYLIDEIFLNIYQ